MMKTRLCGVLLAGSFFAIALAARGLTALAAADEQGVVRVAVGVLPLVAAEETAYSYVGSKKCKKCHVKQYKSWDKTKMAHAIDILKPGNSKERKEEFGIDAGKDYITDPTCLKCHTTGFGKEGGYVVPDPNDKKSVRAAKKLEGVGCESCHGPGSEYVKVFAEIMKSDRKYKVDELYAVGLWKIDANTCTTCHNEESPTIKAGDTFDFEKRKDEGTHEHLPLTQREE